VKFEIQSLRNESEVESKLIVQYLLPELGYDPSDWHQEVALGSIRLDFLAFARQNLPFHLDENSPLSLTIEAKSPKKSLDSFERRLSQYLSSLNARYGVLTNGRDFRIYCYQRSTQNLVLVFRCTGEEIPDRIDHIRAFIGRDNLRQNMSGVIDGKPRQSATIDTSQPKGQSRTMKVISIYHNKGGVGKTTVAVNLAAGLRRRGFRVLLIDLDSQANSTFATGLIKFQFEEDDNLINRNVTHLLESRALGKIHEIALTSDGFNLPEIDVVASHISLIEKEKPLESISAIQTRLPTKLREVSDDYDFVIIDTPPSRNLYAQIGMISSSYLIIPSDLKPFANQGLSNVTSFLCEVNELRESLGFSPCQLIGVLASKISTNSQFLKSSFVRQCEAITKHHQLPLMKSIIYERIALSKSVNQVVMQDGVEIPNPQSVYLLADKDTSANQSAAEFDALVNEVLDFVG